MAKAKNPDTDPVTGSIKVTHTKTCPSLSGKSTITYKLGRHPDGALYLRLHENTGGGFFNGDWINAEEFVEPIRNWQGDAGMSSMVLAALFRGRSANTQAFYGAVLRAEGVLVPYKRGSRRHAVGDIEGFLKQGGTAAPKRKATPRKPRATAKSPSRSKTKASPAA